MLQRWLQRLHRAEDALLAVLLATLLLLAVAQILLRLLFDGGLEWAEPVSRTGVLWLAMFGALGATRSHKHIAIDALPRLLSGTAKRVAWSVSQFAAAMVCGAMAWFGTGMILLEREAPVPFVAGVPSWVPMLVIPFGFGLMALRFVLAGLSAPPAEPEAGEGAA